MNLRLIIAVAGVVGLSLCVLGCDDKGPKRYPISGVVTFENEPVVDGLVLFTPDSSKGNTGPQSTAIVLNGKYATGKKYGILEGPYFASLTGYAEPHPGTESDPRRPLFTEVHFDFEMPAKAHVYDFNLTKEDLAKKN